MNNSPILADDDDESVFTLFKLRAPALFLGLILGMGISFITSEFKEVLTRYVEVAYFLPFVVYVSDSIGAQTENIYSRDLGTGKTKFYNYLKKEFSLGLIFGVLFACAIGAFVMLWLNDSLLALSVSVASFLSICFAPIIALLVTQLFQSIKEDPAAGSGPIATVFQDMVSVIIYGVVCSLIII